jgi:hypothetical protein
MIRRSSRLMAALFLLACADPLRATAQSAEIEVPQYRQLGASEAMASPANPGADFSNNPPSLSGLTLLATIPAPAAARRKVEVAANCAAGITIVLDDQAGASTPTIIPIAGPASDGGQGGSWTTTSHTGRIRIYSSNANCQMAARSW